MRKLLLLLLSLGAFFGAMLAFGTTTSAAIDNTPDCDTVAIIRCGEFSSSKLSSRVSNNADIKKVFAAFGISPNDLKGGYEQGVVWKDGRVTLSNGTVVATNATTAGRWNSAKPGMTRIGGTDRAYKMPTSYFVTEGQTAFIKMKNGKFQFAVIKSCGNPVVAKAVIPSVVCTGLAVKAVNPENFSFKASASVKNANFKKVTYTVKRGGTVVKTIVKENLNTVNYNIATPGSYTVEAVITANAFGERIDTPVGKCKGNFTVKEKVTPEYVCKSLTAQQVGDRTSFVFTPTVALKAATFKSIRYTVTNQAGNTVATIDRTNLNPVSYTQNTTGKYTVKAVVKVTVNGQERTATGTCVANFEVKPAPVTPLYECTKLNATVTAGKANTYTYTLAYIADGGAKLTKVMVDFGDGTAAKEIALADLPTFEYTYAKAGTYTTTATLTFVIDNKTAEAKNLNCATKVTIEEEQKCPVPGKEHLPVDSDECYEPCPHNPELPKDSEECAPTELPNTGPGSIIGLFAATTVAGAAAHKIVWSRRYNG